MTHQESLESKVNETKAMVKFQLKKVLCMGVAVGNVSMEEKQIFQNVQMSVNFLVSLLKKNWQNVSFPLCTTEYHSVLPLFLPVFFLGCQCLSFILAHLHDLSACLPWLVGDALLYSICILWCE